jgi:anti-sigma-K factor RskA
MTEREDIDMLAAEYVLGTLDASERASVAARRQREPLLEQAVTAWEQRLAPLADTAPAIAPPADLLAKIERRLAAPQAHAATALPSPLPSAEIVRLTARVKRWRGMALAASALAASLAIGIGLRETVLAPQPQNFVAVFQKDDALPSFLLSIDLATRQLTIRPVAAEPQAGKTYQLWIASEQLGPAPQSLGLLEEAKAPTRKSLATFDPALLAKATFGVSIEPPGGSPTGRPSGNPLHAKLYPAVP